ncbi:hypothetical protein PVAP13_5NG059580 [Panicum virgatum]|uniref:Uncharacterized protein n=1 Tax=Panicum virgatum TaxID=38727 RepID=A0A8T0S0Z3_PANVG|nr:hypothetical protein PVAP13_5NG059580 [Panicum virgatum]
MTPFIGPACRPKDPQKANRCRRETETERTAPKFSAPRSRPVWRARKSPPPRRCCRCGGPLREATPWPSSCHGAWPPGRCYDRPRLPVGTLRRLAPGRCRGRLGGPSPARVGFGRGPLPCCRDRPGFGTSVCPKATFYFKIAGHSPVTIFSSRVNEGIWG